MKKILKKVSIFTGVISGLFLSLFLLNLFVYSYLFSPDFYYQIVNESGIPFKERDKFVNRFSQDLAFMFQNKISVESFKKEALRSLSDEEVKKAVKSASKQIVDFLKGEVDDIRVMYDLSKLHQGIIKMVVAKSQQEPALKEIVDENVKIIKRFPGEMEVFSHDDKENLWRLRNALGKGKRWKYLIFNTFLIFLLLTIILGMVGKEPLVSLYSILLSSGIISVAFSIAIPGVGRKVTSGMNEIFKLAIKYILKHLSLSMLGWGLLLTFFGIVIVVINKKRRD